MEEKKWYKSKTLWINAIAIAGIILRSEFDLVLTPTGEVAILGAINFILRLITKEKIVWTV